MPCELSTGSDWHRKAISRRNESKRRDTAANCSRPTSRLRATHFYSSFNAPQFRSGSSPWPWACLAGARLACSLSLLCMVGADYWLAIAGSPACQGATIGTETKITPTKASKRRAADAEEAGYLRGLQESRTEKDRMSRRIGELETQVAKSRLQTVQNSHHAPEQVSNLGQPLAARLGGLFG